MEADVDGVVVGVEAGLGASVGVGVSDASVGTGVVVASGVCELAGNAVVAARISCGVSGGSGAGADVAVPAGVGIVATAPPGVGACSPQLSACPGWVSHPVGL